MSFFSGPEMLMVLFVVLLVFGGKGMPEFARGLAKTVRELRKAASEVEREFKSALDEAERAPSPPIRPAPRTVASLPSTALAPAALPPGPPPQAALPPDGSEDHDHPIDI